MPSDGTEPGVVIASKARRSRLGARRCGVGWTASLSLAMTPVVVTRPYHAAYGAAIARRFDRREARTCERNRKALAAVPQGALDGRCGERHGAVLGCETGKSPICRDNAMAVVLSLRLIFALARPSNLYRRGLERVANDCAIGRRRRRPGSVAPAEGAFTCSTIAVPSLREPSCALNSISTTAHMRRSAMLSC